MIVNDFGEASLDEVALAEGEPFRITNIPGGCVCCTAPEGFVDALGAVLAQRPDRLLIEPTGLARPQDLVDTIRRCPHAAALELAPVVVLIDPHQLAGERRLAALLREQAQVADVLVANRTDLASESELAAFERYAAELWPAPLAVLRTQHGALPPERLDWPDGEGRERPPRTSAHSRRSRAVHGGPPRALVALVARRDLLGPAPARRARGARGRPGDGALQGDLPHRRGD